uniref:Plasmid stabilization system protein ParE n=1 Tax=Candidatus Kentrum sp. FM TaxID=2126340 RepID=A0A450T6N6_9GAMM|nr:MAG: Plasmid stabilization system protein ParE [Candidatus Kentron sp. FM]VFJ62419.1 MAG: Plasmid stabilization system protein ParE [Candidatus Kentron sp. FM]VFK13765.1 MAG: Plasmid stabilization system protein ParE [Candidatus Kentron sp. FM]
MAPSIRWSPEAAEDLESIVEYIARDAEFYARAVASKILATSRAIPEQPFMGRVVPEVGNNRIRERFVYSYRLVYEIGNRAITILAVIHGKRLMDRISDRFQ